MTEVEFDKRLALFLSAHPADMSRDELARSFSIAEYTSDLCWAELERRAGSPVTVKLTTPESRKVESPVDHGYYELLRAPPMTEEEVDARLQVVLTGPLGAMSREELLCIVSVAIGARDRIANALEARGMLYLTDEECIDLLTSGQPLPVLPRRDVPYLRYAIPATLDNMTLVSAPDLA